MFKPDVFIKRILDQKIITTLLLILTIASFSISISSKYIIDSNMITVYYFGWFFLFFFITLHAKIILGSINALILLIITFVLTFILEYMGTQGLIPNCEFYYTGDPAFSLLGEVPLLTPLGWLIIFYSGLIMTYIIFNGFLKDTKKEKFTKKPVMLFTGAVTTGLIVLSWDLIHDPVSVAFKAWIWKTKGIYYGIPIMNFVGWFVIAFAIYLLFHFYLLKKKRRTNFQKYSTSWFIMLPVISYLILLTMDVIHSLQINKYYIIPVGLLTMSFFIILTCISFIKQKI